MENKKCIIVTAPSGAGKTTVVKHLLKTYPDILGFSISATNRPRRPNEEDGQDYYFLTTEEFRRKIEKGEFIEYEEVYKGRLYGTLHSELKRLWDKGKVILFDIDVQGALKIRKNLKADCMAIFIKPPNETVLMDRLTKRRTETEEDLHIRQNKVREELSYQNRFDKTLVNDILEVTLKEAELLVEEFLDVINE